MGRSVYRQMHDTKYEALSMPGKLFRAQGVWSIEDYNGNVRLRSTTPSESPTSVTWKWEISEI